MEDTKEKKPRQPVRFRKLAAESVPELWMVQFITYIILGILVFVFGKIANAIIGTKVAALTTANMKQVFLSWQGVVLILIGIAFVLFYVAVDLFLRVHVTGGILRGEKAGIFQSIKASVAGIRRFLNPDGVSILLYVLFAVPLVGIGFSVGVTKNFAIPNFIMDVVFKKPLFTVLYVVVLLALLAIGFFFIFSLHAVLLSGKTPKEAKKYSFRLMKKNWKKFILTMLLVVVVVFLVRLGIDLVVNVALQVGLDPIKATLPQDYLAKDYSDLSTWGALTDTDFQVLGFRVGCALAVLEGGYVDLLLMLLGSAFIMLYFTKLYLEFDAAEQNAETPSWLSRPKGGAYRGKMFVMIGLIIAVAALSFFLALNAELIMGKREPKIWAHRSCGTLGFENSVEGLALAQEHGCIGGEIDIQRTKDGYYIINHDNDFARLFDVDKKPSEMTLAEIEALETRDEHGNIHKVPKLEEFLDEAKELDTCLFLELKGETADEKMADDVVTMVKEHGVEDLVYYISLKDDVINYLKGKYPDARVSSVFFAGMGAFEKLPCDILDVEEGLGDEFLYARAHEAGKEVGVWTPNTEEALRIFMDSEVDYITTDEVELAEQVRSKLDARSEREMITERLMSFWN